MSTFKTTTVNRLVSLHFQRPLHFHSSLQPKKLHQIPSSYTPPAHISSTPRPMSSFSMPPVQPGRIRVLKQGSDPRPAGPVVYWMFRDQRLRDNWALIHAVHQANLLEVPVAIAFNLFHQFKGAKARHLGFMLRGLKKLQSDLRSTIDVPFFLFQASSCCTYFFIFSCFYFLFGKKLSSHYYFAGIATYNGGLG